MAKRRATAALVAVAVVFLVVTVLRSLLTSRLRKSPDSGASMKPTAMPSCSAISANRFNSTVLPTPRRPIGNQLLAYVTAFELFGGLLVYASGGPEEVVHKVGRSGTRLEVATVDLIGEPAEILSSISAIADRVRALRSLAQGSVLNSVGV